MIDLVQLVTHEFNDEDTIPIAKISTVRKENSTGSIWRMSTSWRWQRSFWRSHSLHGVISEHCTLRSVLRQTWKNNVKLTAIFFDRHLRQAPKRRIFATSCRRAWMKRARPDPIIARCLSESVEQPGILGCLFNLLRSEAVSSHGCSATESSSSTSPYDWLNKQKSSSPCWSESWASTDKKSILCELVASRSEKNHRSWDKMRKGGPKWLLYSCRSDYSDQAKSPDRGPSLDKALKRWPSNYSRSK